MENKEIIYNDDVEFMVNGKKNVYKAERESIFTEHNKKLIKNAIIYGSIGLLIALLGIFSLVQPWVAFVAFVGFSMYASFCFGRWFENGKCWGWH